jgi:hypothetical protein
MGVVDDANEINTKLNLHKSNFILLNTPDKSNVYTNANANVIEGYKKMGDKILFYIKIFFKNKNKSHKLRFRTRRNNHRHTSTKTSKQKQMSTSKINRRHNVTRNKTRKIGAFMRV